MATIDQRIVSMVFENAKFEAGIAQSMATLKKFNDALGKTGQTTAFSDIDKQANKVTLSGPMSALDKLRQRFGRSGNDAAQGMSDIEKAGNKVTLAEPVRALSKVQSAVGDVGARAPSAFNEIERSADHISFGGLTSSLGNVTAKFSTLQAAASVALGNIASKAISVGTNVVKSLTLSPVMAGFHNYETQINAVQTIMANTGLSGKKGLGTVQKSLDELNTYANKTVYNFSEMAKNIGTFTAAGVKLKPATAAIKGIANLGALSGSNSQQVSTAMYQLSQAISAGKVGLQDWNSVVNAGMGGAVFQKALMRTGQAMGTISDGAYKVDKATGKATINGETFRNSIMAKPGQQSWLTSDVLTKTLQQFTGDMSDAQLKTEGFSASQIKSIQTQAKTANAAATNIKTISQLMDALKEEVATAWGAIFKTVFGNIFDATAVFSKVHTAIENFLTIPIYNFNKVLQGWAKLGGRTDLFKGIHKAVQDLGAVMKPIKDAFKEIFPPATAKSLFAITEQFKHLMDKLAVGHKTADDIRRIFAGLFAVLHIGVSIVTGVIKVLGDLIGTVGSHSGGFLDFTGSIGDFLVAADKALTRGGLLTKFFQRLEAVLRVPMQLIGKLAEGISHLFGGAAGSKVAGNMGTIKDAADPLTGALHRLKGAWDSLVRLFEQAKNLVSPWLSKIGHELSKVGDVIKDAFSGQNLSKTTAIIQTAFMAGIFVAIRKAIFGGVSQLGGAVKGLTGVLKGVQGVLGGMTKQLEVMQQKVKAQILVEIATAVGILAAAAFVLSTIPPAKLGKAMTAIAVGLGELMGSMRIMTGGLGKAGIAKLPIIAGSLIAMSTALVILAGAMKIMASMSWQEIAKGMAGIAGGLDIISRAMWMMPPGRYMMVQATALVGIGVALNVLAIAMKIFASMSWEELARGLAGVLGSLVALIVPLEALEAIGPGLLIVAPSLIGVSIAMNFLATALKIFASLSPKQLVIGLIGFTATLLLLSEAMWAFPPGPYLAAQAAGMLILGIALQGIAVAMAMFGGLGVGQIVKALVAMGGAMLVLGAGLIFMEGTAPGAAALLLAAAALAILGPALGFIGQLKITTILKGLLGIAAAIAVLAIAGNLGFEGLFLLGAALMPLAEVMFVGAAAVFLFAKALGIMGGAGAKGIGVMIAAITAFVLLLPNWIVTLLKGLLEIVGEIANIAPRVFNALDKILTTVIAFVIREAPKLGLAIGILIGQFLHIIDVNAPKIMASGLKLLETFLSGVAKNIGRITSQGAEIVIRFLDALNGKMPALVTSGANLISSFLTGIGRRAAGIGARAIGIVLHFISGVLSQIPKLLEIGSKLIANLIAGMGRHVARLVVAGAHAILSILSGIGHAAGELISKGVEIAGKFVRGVAHGLVRLADVGASAIINFLNGMATVIRKRAPEIRHAGYNLAGAMIDGLLGGFGELWHKVTGKITELAHKLPGWFRKPLGITSPSKVFHEIGGFIMKGLTNGVTEGSAVAEKSMGDAADSLTQAAKKKLSNVPGLLDGIIEKDPTIRPVLDLSQVKKDAGALGDITSVAPLKASLSMDQASVVSQQKHAADRAHAEHVAAATKPSVSFVQNNHSPEALSTAEIYRKTNNQLSRAKKAVGL